jgi:gliding motility-associated-like protein
VDGRKNSATYTINFLYDTTPPLVSATVPEADSILNQPFDRVAAQLTDRHVGVNLTNSSIFLRGPSGTPIEGEQQNNGVDAIQLRFAFGAGAQSLASVQDGVYTIAVNPVDRLGNATPQPQAFRFRLDATPPKVLQTEPADGAVLVNTPLNSVSVTLDDGANGSGIDAERSSVRLTGPKGEIKGVLSADVSKAGLLTLKLQSPLALNGLDDGRYTITVEAFDKASNPAEVAHATFIYDTAQPGGPAVQNISVQPTAFSPNGDGASDTTRISYILTKPAKMTVSIADERFNVVRTLTAGEMLSAGLVSVSWDGTNDAGAVSPDGTYVITFEAEEPAGETTATLPQQDSGQATEKRTTSAFESVNVVVDTQPPVLSHLTVSDNPFTPDDDGFADVVRLQFNVSRSTPQDNVVVMFYDNLSSQVAAVNVTPAFKGDGAYVAAWNGLGASSDGEYSYTILARDAAANKRELTGAIVMDRNGPRIQRVAPETQAVTTNQSPIRLQGEATDFSGVRTVEVRVLRENGASLGGWQPLPLVGAVQPPVQAAAAWEYVFTPPGDGVYTVAVRATDNVGHTQSDLNFLKVNYDTTEPSHLATEIQVINRHAAPQPIPQKAKRGESIQLVTRWDAPGYTIAVDFFGAEQATAIDNGDGEYLATYKISADAQISEGLKTVRLKAIDAASNQTEIDLAAIDIDNSAPQIASVRSLDADAVYRNGDVISLQLTSDAANYIVAADFSVIDQGYKKGAEQTVNHGDDSYTVTYQIRGDNQRADAEAIPILVSASDGVNTMIDNTLKVTLDNTAPAFGSVIPAAGAYSNGETVVLTVNLDGAGYTVTADFSGVDSAYTTGQERVIDNGDGTYTVRYAVNRANTREDAKNAQIRLQAKDVAGNVASHTATIRLDNTAPEILNVQAANSNRTYKNGDAIAIRVETDDAGYTVRADFSFVDSEYAPEDEVFTDHNDGAYQVSYTISSNNAQGVARTLVDLPVPIIVSDEKHTSRFDKFTVTLDNQPPLIQITKPSELQKDDATFNTARPEITIEGKTEPKGSVTAAPKPRVSHYNPETGEFSMTLTLEPGENKPQLQAADLAGNKTTRTLIINYNQIISRTIASKTGGTVILPEEIDDGIPDNDTRIVIPAGALPRDTAVTITRATEALPSASFGTSPDDMTPHAVYRVVLADTSESAVQRIQQSISGPPVRTSADFILKRPATLVLQYPVLEEKQGSGDEKQGGEPASEGAGFSTPNSKAVFAWDGVHWNNLGGRERGDNTISIQTTHPEGLFAIQTVPSAPTAFEVRPPRPNPFTPNGDGVNDFVTLFFDNPSGKSPSVRIYDLRGALVRELEEAGLTNAVWDGRDDVGEPMPLGVYLYQVEIDDKVKGGTITLAR